MDAKKCDRCGEYYTNECININTESYGSKIHFQPDDEAFYKEKNYDLCPVCTEKLQRFLLNEDPGIVDILTKKPDKTLSESLEEKLALPVEGAPNGPATDCKYCGRMIDRRKEVRACLNPHAVSHPHCTYRCTKFEPKEDK